MWIEAVVQAFKLFVLTASYAIDEAKAHAAEVADAKAKRALFERAVARALAEMRRRTIEETAQVDATDDAIDKKN
jgi:hypothetical protein